MASINLDTASRLDITCRKNDTFNLILNVTDESNDAIDLSSNYAFEIDVRKNSNSSTTLLTFTDSDFTKGSDGKLTINKAASDMDVKAGYYVYDLQATISTETPSRVETWFAGDFIIVDDVTE
tara:strand:+ start:2839 stop:3207 length:369 start_codon:yes stop_codon:yes gene_type:complete